MSDVRYLDLSEEFAALKGEWFGLIGEAGASGRWILGPNVNALEQEIAAYCGTQYAVAVANGTDALVLSLRALNIGPGDEVITSPFTFFASAEAISMVGATPVFADIDATSFNLDPQSVVGKITPRTKGILPVHIFGYPADMTQLMEIAQRHDSVVVEDSAQAMGAEHAGKKVNSFGHSGATSFYPTKVLGGYGDGGMVFCNDQEMVEALHKLRNHGAKAPFEHDELGYNSRLDEIQAALLRIKLRTLELALASRNHVATQYSQQLADLDLVLPGTPRNGRHAFNLYTLRSQHRDQLRQHLSQNQIPTAQCYPVPLHLQDVHAHLGAKRGDLPVVEQVCGETLSLPIYPDMREEQVTKVCESIREFFN